MESESPRNRSSSPASAGASESATSSSSLPSSSAFIPPDWPARAADTIEATVGTVHDSLIRPILLVARAVVFGIVVAAMAFTVAVLMSVALVRLLDVYVFPGRVWASEALVGAALSLIGIVAWSLRRDRSAERG